MHNFNPRPAHFRKPRKPLLPDIARLTRRGLSCRQIALKLGLSKTTVHYWQQKLPRDVSATVPAHFAENAAESIVEKIDATIAGQPAGQDTENRDVKVDERAGHKLTERITRRNARRYDAIYQRAIRAWDRSQADKKVQTVEEMAETDAEGGKKTRKRRMTRKETHAGKPSLLTKALEALKAIDRLKQAAAQQAGQSSSGVLDISIASLSIEDIDRITDEQYEALVARAKAMLEKEAIAVASSPEPVKQVAEDKK